MIEVTKPVPVNRAPDTLRRRASTGHRCAHAEGGRARENESAARERRVHVRRVSGLGRRMGRRGAAAMNAYRREESGSSAAWTKSIFRPFDERMRRVWTLARFVSQAAHPGDSAHPAGSSPVAKQPRFGYEGSGMQTAPRSMAVECARPVSRLYDYHRGHWVDGIVVSSDLYPPAPDRAEGRYGGAQRGFSVIRTP